ncbi:hypothetical protein FZD51_20185 [Bacillus infantis]|uniref:Uncharacterized protein n=1 Tax=Bacillus infantis TaxID=324767 RepID=A0A5D4R1Z2_9BACI|nr:hypothetical protein FZD51_20185 [Bacillus infantis]
MPFKIFKNQLIAVEGTKTPAGNSGKVETPQRGARGGSTPPRGKRSAWNGNQPPIPKANPSKNQLFKVYSSLFPSIIQDKLHI